MMPLSLVLAAARAAKQEAIMNKRRRPATTVAMYLRAEQLPMRWLGQYLVERALAEKSE